MKFTVSISEGQDSFPAVVKGAEEIVLAAG
jgi:hypothetical protein